MALDADLSVDILADMAHVDLGEAFAPLQSFSVLPLGDPRVVRVGRNTVQVESTGTAPGGTHDNRTDYEANSGANDNIAITINELSFQQEITSQEQLQGHKFMTALPELVKTLGGAVWDDITAIILSATYGTSVSGGAAGSFSEANANTMLVNVDSDNVSLLVERSESDSLLPSDRNSFEMKERGAYGFTQIHRVSNFTGATANTMAFACDPAAAVAVAGAPQRDPRVVEAIRSVGALEQVEIPGLGISAELTVWTSTKTRSLWMGLACCFGITAGDGGAGTMATHV